MARPIRENGYAKTHVTMRLDYVLEYRYDYRFHDEANWESLHCDLSKICEKISIGTLTTFACLLTS